MYTLVIKTTNKSRTSMIIIIYKVYIYIIIYINRLLYITKELHNIYYAPSTCTITIVLLTTDGQ